jgi:predicted GIY-YIG superfamily endonuclease
MGTYDVYILRCADDAYYVGSTSDLPGRIERHQKGAGPRFTACRRPVELVYSESHPSMQEARKRERQLKRWSRAKKDALITGDLAALKDLSRRRGPE